MQSLVFVRYIITFVLVMGCLACASEYTIIDQESQELVKLHQDGPFIIGYGDTLRIEVWGRPELRTDCIVRPDGNISLPLVGDMHAEGQSVPQLTKEINAQMGEYILEPSVTVTVTNINSLKVFILGEVKNNGALSLISYMDVLQAIAQAGGLTDYAKRDKIQIIRTEGDKKIKIKFNYNEVIRGKNLEQNIPLKPGDVILVP